MAWALGAFAAIAVLVWVVAWWSVLHPPSVVPVGSPPTGSAELSALLRGWAHWDGSWYAEVSQHGYSYDVGTTSPVAFFPLYPIVIRAATSLVPGSPSPLATGSIITLAAGFVGSGCYWTWCRTRFSARTATTAALLLAVYPYSIYLYGPVYADALFLAGVLGAFILLERDLVLPAALIGAIASAARPTGAILAIALVLRLIEIRSRERRPDDGAPARRRRWWDPRVLRRSDLVIVASGAGFLSYCAYLSLRFGDPFAFATTQAAPGWDQGPEPHTWFKVAFFEEVTRNPLGPASLGLLLQLVCVLAVIAAIPAVARRIGRAYAVLMGLMAAMVMLGSKDFQGAGRYMIPALFPAIPLAAEALDRHRISRAAVLASGLVSLLFFASWFAKGNYLA